MFLSKIYSFFCFKYNFLENECISVYLLFSTVDIKIFTVSTKTFLNPFSPKSVIFFISNFSKYSLVLAYSGVFNKFFGIIKDTLFEIFIDFSRINSDKFVDSTL